MKARKLLIIGFGFALTLGLAACGKSETTSATAKAASSSIAPVASVAVDSTASAAPALTPVAATTAGAAAPNPAGEKVFKSVCFMCHQTGAAGAPMLGNKSDWAPRVAQGKPTLYKHALEGFTGNNGTMPSRGGNPNLKNEDVKAAVDFMVAKAQ